MTKVQAEAARDEKTKVKASGPGQDKNLGIIQSVEGDKAVVDWDNGSDSTVDYVHLVHA